MKRETPGHMQVKTNDKATAGADFASIKMPDPPYAQVIIPVIGTSPLVIHRFSEKARKMMEARQQGKADAKKPPKNPLEDFNGARYTDGDFDCLPAVMFKAAMGEAAKDMEGLTGAGIKRAIIVIGTHGQGSLLPILSAKDGGDVPKACLPTMRTDMTRLETGVADVRYRPEYTQWRVEVPVRYNPRVISLEQLLYLFEAAGSYIGLGELRPCSKKSMAGGTCGMFMLDRERMLKTTRRAA